MGLKEVKPTVLATTMEKPISSDTESRTVSINIAPDEASKESAVEVDEYVGLTGAKLYSVVGALTLVVLMMALDVTVVATAIPKITDHFQTIKDVGWYGSAYIIANATLQPLTGKVYTYYSLTWSYLVFIAIFELGSIICAVSTSSSMLVIGRAVAGIGGAGLMNGAFTTIGVAAAPSKRPMLLAIIMAFFGAGQIGGPIVGGVLTQHASWRWCFWINLPIGALAALALFLVRVPNPNQRHDITLKTFFSAFDIAGWLLFTPACIMLLLGLEWGGTRYAWKSSTIIGLLCGCVATFIPFVLWERRKGEDAMFPGSLLKRTVIWSSCLSMALSTGALLVISYFLPLWFQAVKRETPTTSAIHLMPTFVTQIMGGILAGVLVSKFGYYTPYAILGGVLTAIGAGLMSTFKPTTSIGEWFGYEILIGFGRGLGMQQAMTAVQSSISNAQMSIGMAVISWSQLIGGAIVLSLAETTFTNLLRTELPNTVPGIDPAAVIGAGATNYVSLATSEDQRVALISGYNHALVATYYLCVGCAIAAAATAFGMGWNKAPQKKKKKPSEEVKV